MNRIEETERTWRTVWLLFGALILLVIAIVVRCLNR